MEVLSILRIAMALYYDIVSCVLRMRHHKPLIYVTNIVACHTLAYYISRRQPAGGTSFRRCVIIT